MEPIRTTNHFTPWAICILAAWLLSGCYPRASPPGTICDEWTEGACGDGMECVVNRCVATCDVVGDCDPGYLCDGRHCMPTCETQTDCMFGACDTIDEGREARACLLDTGPITFCTEHRHCPPETICEAGQCFPECFESGDCPEGQRCTRASDRSKAYCLSDHGPDDESAPDPAPGCLSESKTFCASQLGAGAFCDAVSTTCVFGLAVVQVRDVSRTCDSSIDGEPAPGADLAELRLLDDAGSTIGVARHALHFDSDGERVSSDVSRLSQWIAQDACAPSRDRMLSIGCSGAVYVAFADPDTAALVALRPDMRVRIVEHGNECGDLAAEEYTVSLCSDLTALLEGVQPHDCDAFLGRGAGGAEEWVIPSSSGGP